MCTCVLADRAGLDCLFTPGTNKKIQYSSYNPQKGHSPYSVHSNKSIRDIVSSVSQRKFVLNSIEMHRWLQRDGEGLK